jgi:hypothetical protein
MIMRPRHRGTIIISIGLACLGLMTLFSGCTKRVHTEPMGEEGPTPIVTIREFPDVPIPKELKLDAKESLVYMTPEFATGMLVYNGNVDYDSLVRFFDESLTKNGWIIQASLKYTRTLFFYQKENRVCILTMQITPLNVRVEIWVAPIETTAYEPLLKEPPIEPIEPATQ